MDRHAALQQTTTPNRKADASHEAADDASPPLQLRAAPGVGTTSMAAMMSGGNQSMVQLSGDGGAGDVHAAAAHGTRGGGGALPYAGQIQQAFGRHDVGGVKAHTGGAASEACDAMGAQAYASGDAVAFKGAPDLHTAAHEAAHVVQQRAGVSLKGGVGQVGDAYEQHADQVADAVVQGKSAEGLLDKMAGGDKSSEGAAADVQRKANPNAYGARAKTGEIKEVKLAHSVKTKLAQANAQQKKKLLAVAKKLNNRFAAVWASTANAMKRLEKEAAYLESQVNRSYYCEATIVSLNNWIQSFDEILEIYSAAETIGKIDVPTLIKDVKGFRTHARKGYEAVKGRDMKGTKAAVDAAKTHGKDIKGVYDELKSSGGSLGTAFGDVSVLLKNATVSPTEAQALGQLEDFKDSFNPGELLKDKENLKKNLMKAGLGAGQGLMAFATAKGVAKLKSKEAAFSAALQTVHSAKIHTMKQHIRVNYAYWSLTDTIKGYEPGYAPPHKGIPKVH